MRIVFLSDDFPPESFGGGGISTYELAQGVRKAGHEVVVITTCRDEDKESESEYDGLRIIKLATNYAPRWRAYFSIYNPQVVAKLEKVLRKLQPDIVHINNVHFYLSYHSILLSKRYAKRVVVTLRDAMPFSFGKLETKKYLEKFDAHLSILDQLKQARKRWNPLRNYFIKKYLNYADKRVAVSEALRLALKQNGIENVEVIHTGIDPSLYPETPESLSKKILFAGRLSEAKGLKIMEKVMPMVKKAIPEAELVTAGSLQWLSRDQMLKMYSNAGIVVVPSVCFDALPRVVLEGSASGKPVISSPFGGAREIIEDRVTGYIVNPQDIVQFAIRIIDLLSDSDKARKFGQAGRERVIKEFDQTDKVMEYLKIYEG